MGKNTKKLKKNFFDKKYFSPKILSWSRDKMQKCRGIRKKLQETDKKSPPRVPRRDFADRRRFWVKTTNFSGIFGRKKRFWPFLGHFSGKKLNFYHTQVKIW